MIQHTLFFPFMKNMLTDKKWSKSLEWIMIKYIHKHNDHNFFYNTDSKIGVLGEFDV